MLFSCLLREMNEMDVHAHSRKLHRAASLMVVLKIFAFRWVLFPPLKMLQPDVLFETECNQPDVYVA